MNTSRKLYVFEISVLKHISIAVLVSGGLASSTDGMSEVRGSNPDRDNVEMILLVSGGLDSSTDRASVR